MQLTIFVGFLLLRCDAVCIKGTLDTCYPGLAYPSNNNTSTEAKIDHGDFLVLHTAEVCLCSNLCFNNWKLLGFRHYIFLSKLVDSFFVCHTLSGLFSPWSHAHTTLFCNCSGRNSQWENVPGSQQVQILAGSWYLKHSVKENYISYSSSSSCNGFPFCVPREKQVPRPNTVERNPDKMLIVLYLMKKWYHETL